MELFLFCLIKGLNVLCYQFCLASLKKKKMFNQYLFELYLIQNKKNFLGLKSMVE